MKQLKIHKVALWSAVLLLLVAIWGRPLSFPPDVNTAMEATVVLLFSLGIVLLATESSE